MNQFNWFNHVIKSHILYYHMVRNDKIVWTVTMSLQVAEEKEIIWVSQALKQGYLKHYRLLDYELNLSLKCSPLWIKQVNLKRFYKGKPPPIRILFSLALLITVLFTMSEYAIYCTFKQVISQKYLPHTPSCIKN